MPKQYCVYITTNKNNDVLYTGVSGDLKRRIYEHKNKLVSGFTKKYNADKLVYFDCTEDSYAAISREKEIKGWLRKKKIDLIKNFNPEFKDLAEEL